MDRYKVLELAREAELARQLPLEVSFVVDRLERFAALIEREVRGDAEPVASVHIKDGCLIGSQRKSGVDIPDGQYGLYPIGTHPAPAVDAEPVAWSVFDKRTKKHWYTNESKYTVQHYTKEYSHQESDNTLSMVVVPLYTHPAPAVVRQLVEALSRMTDVFLDTEGSYGSYETDAIEFAEQALAAAKESGL